MKLKVKILALLPLITPRPISSDIVFLYPLWRYIPLTNIRLDLKMTARSILCLPLCMQHVTTLDFWILLYVSFPFNFLPSNVCFKCCHSCFFCNMYNKRSSTINVSLISPFLFCFPLPILLVQGRDKDCILVSFVRSSENPRNCTSSLLGDWHRINVALTRAKVGIVSAFTTYIGPNSVSFFK